MDSLIAVIDVGKTHAKLLLVEESSGDIRWERQYVCRAVKGREFRELDVVRLATWLIQTLRTAPERARIRHLVPIAHGAAAVWIDAKGRRLAAPDYEDAVFDQVAQSYRVLRDDYAHTYSPFLPAGQNLGRQFYFIETRCPQVFERATWALLYPQYWAWWLSGIAASEITSLGCHSDLWRPLQSRPSQLSLRQGWEPHLASLKGAGEALGLITSQMALATGLDPACRVYCGMHDSNASYLGHLAQRDRELLEGAGGSGGGQFSVVSSGTWTVVLAQGPKLEHLREERDMLANIDVYGRPVATARFMGGREYAAMAGAQGRGAVPTREWLAQVLAKDAMALPCFSPIGGPYAGHPGSLVHAQGLGHPAERTTLATLYLALMTDLSLDSLGASGAIVVDGPLGSNPLYTQILNALREDGEVYASANHHGAAAAARYLVTGIAPEGPREPAGLLENAVELREYRARWRERVQDLEGLQRTFTRGDADPIDQVS
jgi:L-fuculokinase